MVLHGAGDESEGERAEPKPRVLDEKEETLLSLFNQLPEAEKLRVILHTKAVLQEMDLLKNNVFDLINDLKNRTKELIHTGSTSLGAIFMLQNRTFSCTFCFTNRTFGFIVSFIDNKRIVVRCKTFRWPAIRQTRVRMIDFARRPARQQAVPLNRIEVLIRRLCYLLAQKGDPDA